jgi:hypothetical protein
MPPRATKSRSKKAKPSAKDHQEVMEEERPETTEDAEQTQGEQGPVAGGSVEASHLLSEEAVSASERVSESTESTPGTASQGLTMEERVDKLKALRLKMVSPVLED